MEGERRGGFGFVFDHMEHRHAQRGVDIPRNSAWVGCLVCAAPTVLGMIFGDWISTNRSLLWGWGANCLFPKAQCHPSPALPINGIDGEGEKDGGFNRVLNHFEGRRLIAISSARNSPAPLVSSPRQRSAGRGLWRGEIANSQRDK